MGDTERERERERGRDTGRGRSRPHAGSSTWDSISDPRIRPWAEGGAKPLSHPGCPKVHFLTTELNWKLITERSPEI